MLLPASAAQIREVLSELSISRALSLSDEELSALTDSVDRIAEFAHEHRESLDELDVNPLILDTGGAVTAVDAFIRINR